MIFCNSCGTGNPESSSFCKRCGTALGTLDDAPMAVASARVNSGTDNTDNLALDPTASARPNGLDLGDGLQLPEWLKHAAASTPEETYPASPNAAQDLPAAAAFPTADVLPAQSQGPADMMAPVASAPPAPIAPYAPPAPPASVAQPIRHTSTDSDPSSFISENDLPEWIRQIAAADAIKKAQDDRQSADALAAQAAASEDRAAATDGNAAAQRTQLPAEAVSNGPATSPWLSRRDRGLATGEWGDDSAPFGVAAVDQGVASAPAVAASTPPSTASGKRSRSIPAPSVPPIRLVLIAVIAVLLVLVLVLTFL